MAQANRINVTLDDEYAAKLARLAQQAHVQEGTLARSLLSRAIDEADIDARDMVRLLDGIPGARERFEQGLRDIEEGRTVSAEAFRRRGDG
jgi:predicted transcriptional regulator